MRLAFIFNKIPAMTKDLHMVTTDETYIALYPNTVESATRKIKNNDPEKTLNLINMFTIS